MDKSLKVGFKILCKKNSGELICIRFSMRGVLDCIPYDLFTYCCPILILDLTVISKAMNANNQAQKVRQWIRTRMMRLMLTTWSNDDDDCAEHTE